MNAEHEHHWYPQILVNALVEGRPDDWVDECPITVYWVCECQAVEHGKPERLMPESDSSWFTYPPDHPARLVV